MTLQKWCVELEKHNNPDISRFLVGDTVKLRRGYSRLNKFPGNAIFQGLSTPNVDNIALERLDGGTGSAQNGYWNFQIRDSAHLMIVKKVAGIRPRKKREMGKEEAHQIFNQLLKHKEVRGVVVDDKELHIATAPLFLSKRGYRKTELGQYLICIPLNARIFIQNLTYSHSYPHPHINNDNTPCFNEYAKEIKSLLTARTLPLLVNVLIRYLTEGYSASHSYIRILQWVEERELIK